MLSARHACSLYQYDLVAASNDSSVLLSLLSNAVLEASRLIHNKLLLQQGTPCVNNAKEVCTSSVLAHQCYVANLTRRHLHVFGVNNKL